MNFCHIKIITCCVPDVSQRAVPCQSKFIYIYLQWLEVLCWRNIILSGFSLIKFYKSMKFLDVRVVLFQFMFPADMLLPSDTEVNLMLPAEGQNNLSLLVRGNASMPHLTVQP